MIVKCPHCGAPLLETPTNPIGIQLAGIPAALVSLLLEYTPHYVSRSLVQTLWQDRSIDDIDHSVRNAIYSVKTALEGHPNWTLDVDRRQGLRLLPKSNDGTGPQPVEFRPWAAD